MRIAVPAADRSGLDATVSDHFGRSPYFTIFDEGCGEVEVVPNISPHHGSTATDAHGGEHGQNHGHGYAFSSISSKRVDVLVCRGLGVRASKLFTEMGIRVFCCADGSVSDAIDAWKTGKLSEAGPENACHHGHH